MAKDYDPMAKTNSEFYNMINAEDWQFNFDRELEIQDAEVQEFSPPVMQYWIPSPIPGLFIRIDFTLESEETDNKKMLDFLNNLHDFLGEEDN